MPRGFDHIAHAVRDLDAAQELRSELRSELLSRANLPVHERTGRLIVGPDTALGATLAFERN